MTPEQLREIAPSLRTPSVALLNWGKVQDQATSEVVDYDPYKLTNFLQSTIISYVSDPPRDDNGHTLWLNVLKSRQGGASVTTEYSFYPLAAYTQKHNHMTIADNDARAKMLHQSVQFLHSQWPEAIRAPTVAHNETQKLSFLHGGGMKTASGRAAAVGIGMSIDSFHGSENAFWEDFPGQWSMIQPGIINRANALVVNECTPATQAAPSAEAWRDYYEMGKRRSGRWASVFLPFWDTKLCRRRYDPSEHRLEDEEIRLLNEYGHLGLTAENLMFRRHVLATDREIRRDPELFWVYYPRDDISCWGVAGELNIREEHFARRDHRLVPANGQDYQEFEAPDPEAIYIMGVDGSGYGTDHSAFVVAKAYVDEVTVVATFSGNLDPNEFNDMVEKVGRRYNAFIAVERNGVGLAVITSLVKANYPRIILHTDMNPGIPKTSHEQVVSAVVDAILDVMVIRSEVLKRQCLTYRGDRDIAPSTRSLLVGRSPSNRRDRHHWDMFSALAMLCIGRRSIPIRYKPITQLPDNVIPVGAWTWNMLERFRKANEPDAPSKASGRRKFRRRL